MPILAVLVVGILRASATEAVAASVFAHVGRRGGGGRGRRRWHARRCWHQTAFILSSVSAFANNRARGAGWREARARPARFNPIRADACAAWIATTRNIARVRGRRQRRRRRDGRRRRRRQRRRQRRRKRRRRGILRVGRRRCWHQTAFILSSVSAFVNNRARAAVCSERQDRSVRVPGAWVERADTWTLTPAQGRRRRRRWRRRRRARRRRQRRRRRGAGRRRRRAWRWEHTAFIAAPRAAFANNRARAAVCSERQDRRVRVPGAWVERADTWTLTPAQGRRRRRRWRRRHSLTDGSQLASTRLVVPRAIRVAIKLQAVLVTTSVAIGLARASVGVRERGVGRAPHPRALGCGIGAPNPHTVATRSGAHQRVLRCGLHGRQLQARRMASGVGSGPRKGVAHERVG